jgi:hypothetical protein
MGRDGRAQPEPGQKSRGEAGEQPTPSLLEDHPQALSCAVQANGKKDGRPERDPGKYHDL